MLTPPRSFRFEGDACGSKSECPADCSSRGVCRHSQCLCALGAAGADCSKRVPRRGCPNSCSAHGVCQDGKCLCDEGWRGVACEAAVTVSGCEADCSGHGFCVEAGSPGSEAGAPPRCECAPGFAGPDCNRDLRCPFECAYHGVCDEGQCLCASGWSGFDCGTTVGAPPPPNPSLRSLTRRRECSRSPSSPQAAPVKTKCPKDCSERGVWCVAPPAARARAVPR